MPNFLEEIFQDEKKFQEVKRIAERYGIRLTSGVLLTVYLFSMTSSKAIARKQDLKDMDYQAVPKSISVGVKATKVLPYDIPKPKLMTEEEINQEKIQYILDKYQLTREELDVCCAIAMAEANGEGTNYEEAMNVINTAYNRTISRKWVASISDNLFEQMTYPGQFVVYENGNYLRFLGRTDLPGYQAVIDFLSNTNEVKAHTYLAFRSNHSGINGAELVDGGNLYFSTLTEEDRLFDVRVEEAFTLKLSLF